MCLERATFGFEGLFRFAQCLLKVLDGRFLVGEQSFEVCDALERFGDVVFEPRFMLCVGCISFLAGLFQLLDFAACFFKSLFRALKRLLGCGDIAL